MHRKDFWHEIRQGFFGHCLVCFGDFGAGVDIVTFNFDPTGFKERYRYWHGMA